MNELTCEMCGSTNVVKQEGLYVCQSCGTKYSPEEAKKIMEGTVEVTGTVKVDSSSELENLYEIARRARDSENSENALKYYDQILMKDANSWEAQFYVVYFRAMSCKIGEIGLAATNVYKSFDSVLNLIKKNTTEEEQTKAVAEICARSHDISLSLFNGALNTYKDISFQFRHEFKDDYSYYSSESIAILFVLGDKLVEVFPDQNHKDISATIYKEAINLASTYVSEFGNSSGVKDIIPIYTEKIREVDSSYEAPITTGGCYVATSIYGSYDCPEVWTLRRFRDNTLAKSLPGILFIKFYYAVSPTVVKYLGETKVFKNLFKPILDKFVSKLQEEGVESSSYIDE